MIEHNYSSNFYPRFPLKNSELLKRWLDAINRSNWNPSVYDCVCSKHFSKEEIEQFNIRQDTSSIFIENAVYYIAGFVISKLANKLHCDTCLTALKAQMNEHDYAFITHSRFTQLKDNGGLCHPWKSVLRICTLTESRIRQNVFVDMKHEHIYLAIEVAVMTKIVDTNLFIELQEHMFDSEMGMNHHRNTLIRQIIKLYAKVRLYKIAKDKNLQLKGQAIRHKLSKQILFQGQ